MTKAQTYMKLAEWKVCSICEDEYQGWGNNADPYEGRCCDLCNSIYVLPARIDLMQRRFREPRGQ